MRGYERVETLTLRKENRIRERDGISTIHREMAPETARFFRDDNALMGSLAISRCTKPFLTHAIASAISAEGDRGGGKHKLEAIRYK